MTEKEIDKIADRVAEKLMKINKSDKYKETEAMLRAYPNYKKTIERNNERVKEILENGLGETKKVRPVENVQGGLKKYEGIPEIELERIEHLKSENVKIEKRVIRVDNALDGIKDDRYYDIIVLRYFKEWTIDEIAEDFEVNRRTIGRNRTRLIKKLQYSLFPEVLLD